VADWDGQERRRITQVHVVCAKEHEWGELTQSLRNIAATQERIEKNQETILHEIFGNGKDGLKLIADRNKQSVKRLWWWTGSMTVAIIIAAVAIIIEHFKGAL